MAEAAPNGGFGQFIREADAAQQAQQAAEAQNQALQAEQQAWTVNSQIPNREAELRVFGTLSGAPERRPDGTVIDRPTRADQIRGDATYGADPRERSRLAALYGDDIRSLTEEHGLELFQAERIAEQHLSDTRSIWELAGRFTTGNGGGSRYEPDVQPLRKGEKHNPDLPADAAGRGGTPYGTRKSERHPTGRPEDRFEDRGRRDTTPEAGRMDADAAVERAQALYDRNHARRIRFARLESPITREAEIAANGEASRSEQALMKKQAQKAEREDPEKIARREAEQKEIAGLQERLVGARDDYARRVAGNSRRAIHWRREFRNGGVTEARRQYEAIRNHLGGIIGALYARDGANAEQIDIMAWNGARAEGAALAREIREEKLIATGRGRYTRDENDDGTALAVRAEHGGLYRFTHAPANALYNFYARNSVPATGGRRAMQIAKKTVVIGAVGTGAGLAAGLLAGAALPVGAGVAGALAANRITKAYMSSRVRRGARARLVDVRTSQLQGNMNAWIDDINANGVANPNAHVGARQWDATVLTDFSERQRRREVRGNRIRLGVMAGGLALGGYGLEHLVMHGQDTQDFFGGNGGAHEHAQSGSGNSNTDIGGNRFPWNHGGMGSKGHSGSTPGAGGEVNPGEVNPSQLPEVNLHGAEYPWNWAAGKFGADQATPEMLKLVHGLKEHGVDMKVVPLPGNKFAIEGPGADFSTEDVVRYLNAEYEYEQLANAS